MYLSKPTEASYTYRKAQKTGKIKGSRVWL